MISLLTFVVLAQAAAPVVIADPTLQTKRAKVTSTAGGALQVECVGGTCSGGGGAGAAQTWVTVDGGYVGVWDGTDVAQVTPAGRLTVDGSGVTQPVSAASLPLPAGAATSAAQTTGNGSLSSIDGKLPNQVSGRVPVDPSGVTSPISAAALPLPSGASTEATLALIKAKTDNIDVALSTRTKPADQQHVVVDTAPTTAVTGPLTDAQLRASAVPVSLATAPTTPVTGTFWPAIQPVSTPDGGMPASDDAAQRAATDLMAIRQLLEQLVQLQQQQAVQLQALKDPGK